MRGTGLSLLGRSAWAILTWLAAGLCLVQMSACTTAQPVPVRTMTATVRFWRGGSQTVYWRAPDQQAILDAPGDVRNGPRKVFRLLNATGHPHSVLESEVFGTGTETFVISNLVFAEKLPRRLGGTLSGKTLEHLRDMDFPCMTARGTEVVDSAPLVRYELPYGITESGLGFRTTIWADPQTKRAVRFRESDAGSKPASIPPIIVEISDIKFDEPLDDSLFRWPTLWGTSPEQQVNIIPPPYIPRMMLKISFESPDGRQLIITGTDLKPMMFGTDRDLGLASGESFKQFMRACVGKRVRVTLNGLPAQEMEVVGVASRRLYDLQVYYPYWE